MLAGAPFEREVLTQAANSVVGYTRNGGTVYGDGRIVGNAMTWHGQSDQHGRPNQRDDHQR